MKSVNRLKFLRIIICLGLLLGILFSHELWFPITRTFPQVPLVFEAPVSVARIFTAILVLSLILIVFSFRTKVFSVTAIVSLISLIFFDQIRLQPWVYQYLLILVILALHNWQSDEESSSNRTLGLVQLMIAGLYFWSGLQKLNFTFSHQTLPMLLEPLQCVLPANPPFVLLGVSLALVETFIGGGLFFRKTRNLSVWLTVSMHMIILTLLIAKNYNSIVWIWNVVLAAMVIIAFFRSNVAIGQIFTAHLETSRRTKLAVSVVIAGIILPILSFVGLWDLYLSGALYSGNVEVGVVRIDDAAFQALPPKAKVTVFRTKSTNEQMLPLHEWALNDLNVPVYPQKRVFAKVARKLCEPINDKTQIQLIIKERPAILDGSYNIVRISCLELEKD